MISLIKTYLATLRASAYYGKANRCLGKGNYLQARKHAETALNLKSFSFMRLLCRAMLGEIDYEAGRYEDAKQALERVRDEISAHPEDWRKPAQLEFEHRVDCLLAEIDRQGR